MRSLLCGDPAKIFKLPATSSGHSTTLTVGHCVSLYCDLQPSNTWPAHEHPVAQVVVALDPVEAEVRWLQEGKWIAETVRTTHVWFVPAKVRHAATWRSTAAMLVLFVGRDYILEECGVDLTECTVCELGSLIQRDYLAGRFCRKFHELCHGKRSWSRMLTAASGTLLAAWLLRAHLCPVRIRPAHRCGLSDDRLQRVTNYIDTHLCEPLTRALLARVAGQTEFHFSRMFKVAAGLPPMKYVWRCRIFRARQLLETGEWKVAAAAAETGYCDQSHLDRQFRKEFGCSPGSVVPKAVESGTQRPVCPSFITTASSSVGHNFRDMRNRVPKLG